MTDKRLLWFWSCLSLGLWFTVDLRILPGGLAGQGDDVRAEDNALIDQVRSIWRAQDGETAEQIFAKVAKVAHFVPKGWERGRKTDAGEPVVLSWARHRTDKAEDDSTVTWEVGRDGTVTLVTPSAKPMELGWRAFALSLLADEATSNETGVNRRFLHDPANFNFVTTAQGKLGDLLRRGRCIIGDGVKMHYLPTLDEQQTVKDGLWRVQLSVDCDVQGAGYSTRDVIIFEKREGQDWEPQSFLAKRLATYAPESLFDFAEPKDQEPFDAARKALAK
ncbi:nodulate formation efficiency C protein [Bradyrhizobium sp. CCGUVB1N3]|uniref:nodulate formation efficiency C protein n=1 Tax=Bradyrhizobium sp. CCGUVB1N3 TaxID=2949629 RepID=UPI0020B35E5B|nr:nodulate formation efficiency C protein [Bradyrhizobium sp. CCGUVB1N3]MCP3475474.1 nodulate formation efficiency C protein [Bradyrhizobium sp. CCGUVB1N3]MCP3475519.1 nodulate formation efficiency C protein [Bradyrhizobium sp. CCGUVB1N3]